jgi:hypothetical protein
VKRRERIKSSTTVVPKLLFSQRNSKSLSVDRPVDDVSACCLTTVMSSTVSYREENN